MPNNREKMIQAAAENTKGESMQGPDFERPGLSWTLAEHEGKHSKQAPVKSDED
ncbi:hypothetical protein [Peribacillus glennii]|uniref:hypothetical protein n=1 Tax=Peribacillus glennii TaxID=2303991 RepID=UPI0013140FCA|nr:hypothetical protein [Peribacillus glennii]